MSKAIKIGDFIERVNNLDFKTGTKIKFQDKIYLYDYPDLTGIYEIGKPTKKEYSIFAQLDITNLHSPVEIIEEQEEIEEIEIIRGWGLATDYKDFETINHTLDRFGNKINELVQAVKYLDNKLKEK